jgi:hypothetical protein
MAKIVILCAKSKGLVKNGAIVLIDLNKSFYWLLQHPNHLVSASDMTTFQSLNPHFGSEY